MKKYLSILLICLQLILLILFLLIIICDIQLWLVTPIFLIAGYLATYFAVINDSIPLKTDIETAKSLLELAVSVRTINAIIVYYPGDNEVFDMCKEINLDSKNIGLVLSSLYLFIYILVIYFKFGINFELLVSLSIFLAGFKIRYTLAELYHTMYINQLSDSICSLESNDDGLNY